MSPTASSPVGETGRLSSFFAPFLGLKVNRLDLIFGFVFQFVNRRHRFA